MNLRGEGKQGVAAYSGGFFDCKKQVLDLLGLKLIPGSTNVKPTVPSVWYGVPKKNDTHLYCFRDYGNYFILNRTPDTLGRKRWSWDDSQCKNSWLRINHL